MTMTTIASNFIWYELFTTDTAAAQKFYGQVVGWTTVDSGQTDKDYRVWMAKDQGVGGLLAIPKEAPNADAKPRWLGYIHVADVDRAVSQLTGVGGHVHWPATDIPGVGRIARVSDPQGAEFYVMDPKPMDARADAKSTAFAEGVPGHCSWNELQTTNAADALKFYKEHFGWTSPRSMDMGPMGSYHVISADGKSDMGGMMNMAPECQSPAWKFYFCVDDIDAAQARATAAGGVVLNGPHQVPGGNWIVQAKDPQDCTFALVGPRKSA
jgi:predicted enzyme related to lactoylglutathione lyase